MCGGGIYVIPKSSGGYGRSQCIQIAGKLGSNWEVQDPVMDRGLVLDVQWICKRGDAQDKCVHLFASENQAEPASD